MSEGLGTPGGGLDAQGIRRVTADGRRIARAGADAGAMSRIQALAHDLLRERRAFRVQLPRHGGAKGERSILREYLEAFIIAAVFLLLHQHLRRPDLLHPERLDGGHPPHRRPPLRQPVHLRPHGHRVERKLLPFRTVQSGDIVVFRSPENPTLDLVKRCMAVGGDTVEMVDQQLYINGKEVNDSSFAVHKDRERRPWAACAIRACSAGQLRPLRRARRPLLLHGRQPRQLLRLAVLGDRCRPTSSRAGRSSSTGPTAARPRRQCRGAGQQLRDWGRRPSGSSRRPAGSGRSG